MALALPDPWQLKPERPLPLDRSHPLARGLIGGWLFNEGAGARVDDIAGHNDGIITGSTVRRLRTRYGQALDCSGNDNDHRVDLGPLAPGNPLSLTGDRCTFLFRCRHLALAGNSFPRILDKSNGSFAANGFAIYWSETGSDWRLDVNGTSYASNGVVATTAWQSIAITKDGGTLRFHRNGALIGTRTGVKVIPATTTNAAIGNWNHTTDRNWEGQIDYLHAFDHVLADAERRALQAAPYQILAPIRRRSFSLARKPDVPGLPPAAGGGQSIIRIAA